MAKQTTGTSSAIEYRKDEKTRYMEMDNVKDLAKADLKKLQEELKPKTAWKLEEEINLESELQSINDHIEKYFD